MRQTKILATLGPATRDEASIGRLLDAGANAFRLNFSHGSDAEHRALLRRIHRVADARTPEVAVVADLQGPKIRLGDLREPKYHLNDGAEWTLDTAPLPGDEHRAPVSLPELAASVRAGDPLLLGDGSVELVVDRVEGGSVRTRVVHGGTVTPHAGLFLPRAHLRTAILGAKDRRDLALALREGIDYVALSFVRDASDLDRARAAVERLGRGRSVGLIAKIERAEALQRIDAILEAADAIMVARGDLGIEVPLERLALEQKRLVAKANRVHKPVIVATQMLLSMVASPRPTRAEATDVANAVLDGADAVMLSEESAVGSYPFESVRWLDRICARTEEALASGEVARPAPLLHDRRQERSVAEAAAHLAGDVSAIAIVTPTHSGRTARLVSALRPSTPVLALSSQPETRRRLALVWGVVAHPCPKHLGLDALRAFAQRVAGALPGARPGASVVLTAGYPIEGRPTNLVTVIPLEAAGPPGRVRAAASRGSGGRGRAAAGARG